MGKGMPMRPVWQTRISSAVDPIPPATATHSRSAAVAAGCARGRVRVARGEDHARGGSPGGGEVGPAHLDRCRRGQVGGEHPGRRHGTAVRGGHHGDVGQRRRP